MAKISSGSNYELLARNYMRTEVPEGGGPYGVRAVLRSDGAILFRVRWTTNHKGEREKSRSSSFTKLPVSVKADHLEAVKNDPERQVRMLDQVMARRRFEYEPDTPKPEAPKPDVPQFASLREKITWEQEQRKLRYAEFEVLHKRAVLAGKEAAAACVPEPMVVIERVNPIDDNSPIKKAYAPIEAGVCGFAWVQLRSGNSSFAHWAKKYAGYRTGYNCVQLWVSDFGQSMERKAAFARAYAAVLEAGGIQCWASSRMD